MSQVRNTLVSISRDVCVSWANIFGRGSDRGVKPHVSYNFGTHERRVRDNALYLGFVVEIRCEPAFGISNGLVFAH
jgi:hypothetical protein